jgi:hypothetical protein
MQAKDIPDKPVLEFLAKHQGKWATWGKGYSMPTVKDAMPEGTPDKLQLAKMKSLQKRGFIGGCMCGCRGDFEITDLGLAYVGLTRTTPYNGYGHKEGSIVTGLEGQIKLLEKFGYRMELASVTHKPDPENNNMMNVTAIMNIVGGEQE